jgi:hypothetical protein
MLPIQDAYGIHAYGIREANPERPKPTHPGKSALVCNRVKSTFDASLSTNLMQTASKVHLYSFQSRAIPANDAPSFLTLFFSFLETVKAELSFASSY